MSELHLTSVTLCEVEIFCMSSSCDFSSFLSSLMNIESMFFSTVVSSLVAAAWRWVVGGGGAASVRHS